jgi:2-dehydro-3-deoxy-D-gluconate 5-dehydrogenase
MNLNMKGLYFLSQAAGPHHERPKGGGKIINVASIDGFHPERTVSIYSISKAGVRMITKAFASELARSTSRSTPSPRAHPHQDDGLPLARSVPRREGKGHQATDRVIPMGRIGVPDDIVGAAVYLASAASNYTTGAEIVIDGAVLLAPLINAPGVPI